MMMLMMVVVVIVVVVVVEEEDRRIHSGLPSFKLNNCTSSRYIINIINKLALTVKYIGQGSGILRFVRFLKRIR
jgi:hypothetical protein